MTVGRYAILAAALLSMAISGPLIRFANAAAAAIVVWRMAFAWPVVATVALARRDRWPWVGGSVAGALLGFHLIAWVIAVQRTTIANAALLITTGALWSALLSRPLLREAVTRRQWLGLAIAGAGVVFVLAAKGGGQHHVEGDLWALAGALAWTAYVFIGRRARQHGGFWGYAAAVYAGSAVTALVGALVLGVSLAGFDRTTWLTLAALAVLPTLLGHGGLNYLLRFVGPARLSLWTLSEPVLATIVAWPLFGETPPAAVVVGGAATLAGIALGVGERTAIQSDA